MQSASIQGTRVYTTQLRDKATAAIAKLESIGIHNGHIVMPDQTQKYYNSTVLSVLKANLAQHQLDTPNGDYFRYELARKMTAKVLRRMLGTSNRTSPVILILEANWDLPDKAIIVEKLSFQARMAQRVYNEKKKQPRREDGPSQRKDSATHVWKGRLTQVEQGETRGLCAEAKRPGKKQTWKPNGHLQRPRKRAGNQKNTYNKQPRTSTTKEYSTR